MAPFDGSWGAAFEAHGGKADSPRITGPARPQTAEAQDYAATGVRRLSGCEEVPLAGGGLLAVPVLASGVDETCERPEHGVQGVPVEEIARLVGHSLTATTETVYRRELRPVMSTGAEVMDTNFKVG